MGDHCRRATLPGGKACGLTKVPVIIREVPDKKALSLSLIENIQREGLNPIEEANGMSRLMREFDMTQDQVAEVLARAVLRWRIRFVF